MFFVIFFAFFFGLAAGSFLNLVADRLPRGESILGRSRCPHCRRTLSWAELIPVLSFLALRGRCGACRRPIPREHPLVEIATGLLFAGIAYLVTKDAILMRDPILGDSLLVLRYALGMAHGWFIGSVLVAIFLSDLKYYIIPDRVVLPASAVALVVNMAQDFFAFRLPLSNTFASLPVTLQDTRFGALFTSSTVSGLFAAFLGAFFFLALIAMSRGRWMGLGDVKFGMWMGLVVGWPGILPAIFLSFFLGSLVALPLVLIGRKTMKSFLPFGAFLAPSTLVWVMGGEVLNRWVLYTFIGL